MSHLLSSKEINTIPDEFWNDCQYLNNIELAGKYDRSVRTIERWRKVARQEENIVDTKYGVPISTVTNYHEMGTLKITGDVLVASDWHIPFHSAKWVKRLLQIAKEENVKQLAIPGDFFDASGLSSFDAIDLESNIAGELQVASRMLTHLLQWFDSVYWAGGNHELRLPRSLRFQASLPDICSFITKDSRVRAVDREELVVISGGIQYYLIHPRSYSVVPTNIARSLAEKYHTNVISAHGHSFGMSYSRSGEYLALDAGGLFDIQTTTYINRGGLTTHPSWINGFWLIKDGVPYPYSELSHRWQD